jgi:serine/threonine protein kinase
MLLNLPIAYYHEDIEDFSVEIDILAECKHKNVVSLYEAFFYDSKLWVSWATFFLYVNTHILYYDML